MENAIGKTNSLEEKILNKFKTELDSSKKTIQEVWHPDLKKWEKAWNDVKDEKRYPYYNSANFSAPVSSTATDALVSRHIDEIFGLNDPFTVKGIDTGERGDVLEDEVTKLMKWDYESNEDLQEALWFFVENSHAFGTGFAYTFLNKKKDIVDVDYMGFRVNGVLQTDPTIIDMQGNPQPIELTQTVAATLQANGLQFEPVVVTDRQEKWVEYGPKTICLENENVFWKTGCKSLKEAFETGFVAIRVFYTYDEIVKRMQVDGKSKLSEASKSRLKEEAKKKNPDENSWRSEKMEFFLMFGRVLLQENGDTEEKIVALFHGTSDFLISWEKFPYDHGHCPVVAGYIHPRQKKVPGKGIPEKLNPIKQAIDVIRNQRSDRRSVNNAPPLMHTKESGFIKAKHKPGFGAVWRLNKIGDGDIRYLTPPSESFDSYKDEDILQNEAQTRLGLSNSALGMEANSDQTFRGILQLLEEGSKNRSQFKKWLCRGIREIFWQRFMIYKQFWSMQDSDPEVRQWVNQILDNSDNALTSESIEALNHNFNITLKASAEDRREALLRAQDTFQFLSQDPDFNTIPGYKRKVIIDVLRASGNPDPENYYPTLEEIQQYRIELEKEAQRQIMAEQEEARKQQLFETEKQREIGRTEKEAEILQNQEPQAEAV